MSAQEERGRWNTGLLRRLLLRVGSTAQRTCSSACRPPGFGTAQHSTAQRSTAHLQLRHAPPVVLERAAELLITSLCIGAQGSLGVGPLLQG